MAFSSDHLNALFEISKEINSILEQELLFKRILDVALKHLQAERGFILIKQAASKDLSAVATQNINPDKSSDMSEISRSTIEKVISGKKPILAFNTQSNQDFDSSKSIILQKISSIACVPLLLKGELIGVIYIDSRNKTAGFDQLSLEFLEAFANQAAIAIENARLTEQLKSENEFLKAEFHRLYAFKGIVGKSKSMQQVFEMVGRVLNNPANVLLTGETGTGKEIIARAIHQNGPRKDKPFVAINCAVIPEALLESELFGHKKGAFTGAVNDKRGLIESADEGTLFLDEIGEMPAALQVKLLRFIQERTFNPVGSNETRSVNVRIIAASNRNLEKDVQQERFREDLFYRLNVINIHLPPLRERSKDIPLLVNHFLKKFSREYNSKRFKISSEAMEKLNNYHWPGNVRELENIIERALVMSQGNSIEASDIELGKSAQSYTLEPGMTVDHVSNLLLKKTLDSVDGNKTLAAKMMGVSLRWVHYRLKNIDK